MKRLLIVPALLVAACADSPADVGPDAMPPDDVDAGVDPQQPTGNLTGTHVEVESPQASVFIHVY